MASITQLTYILAVDQTRHFGHASKLCHVSQPSLSAQIKKVEDDLGYPLFDRSHKPIVPTLKGEVFIRQARVVLNEHQRLIHMAKREGKLIRGPLRLGIIPTISPYLLPYFLETFAHAYPKVFLTLEELTTGHILDALKHDRLDAAILATPLGDNTLKEWPVYQESFWAYLSPKHPLRKRAVLQTKDLSSEGLWLLQEGHCLRTQVLQVCSGPHLEGGAYPNVSFQSGTLETLRKLIQHGSGHTLLPHLMVLQLSTKERAALVRPIKGPPPTREVSLVFRPDTWKIDILEVLHQTILASLPSALLASKGKRPSPIAPL